MKNARTDKRKVTLRYLHDGTTGKTTLTIDVEAPEEDMPHEHRQDLKEMAEELLGVPLGSLPEDINVRLKRAKDDHDHGHEHEHPPASPEREDAPPASGRQGVKA